MKKLAALCAIAALTLATIEALRKTVGTISLDDARLVRCASDIRQLQMLVGIYFQDHDAFPMSTHDRTWHEVLADGGYLPRRFLTGSAWLDPWGQPYEYVAENDPPSVWSSACQSPMVMSCGVNGLNEGGAGDDVVLR